MLLAVGTGTFLTALAGSAVTLALPNIGRELGITLELSSWVLQGFLLVVTVLLLIAGRLGDLVGHRRIYLVGFGLFGAASALCGLAQSFWLLVLARVVQGVGGAALMATAPALLSTAFPAARRGQALGVLATATYSGLTLGPPVGGLVIGSLGWRWLFFLNVPVAVLVVGLGLGILPSARQASRWRIDGAGTATLLLGLPLLLLALTQGESWGWASGRTLGLLAGAGIVLAAFVEIERRQRDPLLDLDLFRSPVFRAAVLGAVSNYMALFVPVVLLPFYLTEGLRMAPSRAGLLLALQPLAMALVASPSGRLSDRLGTRAPATVGLLVMAAALAVMVVSLGSETGFRSIGLRLALLGLGTGIFISPNSSALMGAAPIHQQGIAGGVLAEARNLGMLMGVAAATALFHGSGGQTGGRWAAADYHALRVALAAAAAICLAGAAAVFLGRREASGS